MKSPLRAGTLASTFVILLVICIIIRHSEYVRDRWNHIDEIKDEIANGWRDRLGHSGSRTTVDPKYIGFGTPSPVLTPQPTPPYWNSSPSPVITSAPDDDHGNGNSVPEYLTGEATPGVNEEQSPPSGTEVEGETPEVVEEDEPQAEAEDTTEGESLEALPDKIVVMGKTAQEDTTWVEEQLPEWANAIYAVDDLNATLHTPMNKGKEAMAYLTYLIENYGNYPSTVAFIHSHKDRFWHGAGMPARSNMVALKALQTDYVQSVGFASLRCTLGPGCPAEVQPFREDTPFNRLYERSMAGVWELFFDTPCPEVIAAPCCAQFAVSRDQIMMRPLEDYVLYRQWLMETDLDDDNSGRIFEYLWHIIFGREPVHCPDYGQCWADVYGNPSMADLHNLLYAGSS